MHRGSNELVTLIKNEFQATLEIFSNHQRADCLVSARRWPISAIYLNCGRWKTLTDLLHFRTQHWALRVALLSDVFAIDLPNGCANFVQFRRDWSNWPRRIRQTSRTGHTNQLHVKTLCLNSSVGSVSDSYFATISGCCCRYPSNSPELSPEASKVIPIPFFVQIPPQHVHALVYWLNLVCSLGELCGGSTLA